MRGKDARSQRVTLQSLAQLLRFERANTPSKPLFAALAHGVPCHEEGGVVGCGREAGCAACAAGGGGEARGAVG